VGVKSTVELGPQHLVDRRASGSIAMQLLHGKESLLHLRAVQEPKLGLDHLKPMIGLESLSCLGEVQRVSGREVIVGSQS
jgi:hypothetical protein